MSGDLAERVARRILTEDLPAWRWDLDEAEAIPTVWPIGHREHPEVIAAIVEQRREILAGRTAAVERVLRIANELRTAAPEHSGA